MAFLYKLAFTLPIHQQWKNNTHSNKTSVIPLYFCMRMWRKSVKHEINMAAVEINIV
jgi:hypothetical protein